MGMDHPPTPSQAVSILDRKIVGVFETTTITSPDAKALQTWLSQNGFTVPTNAEPVIASYVKDGWVFVGTKVRRDKPDNETSTPHPLSFTFKTDKPVYPMRLTGVNNGPLSVELYLFGPSRAKASHFKVERCAQPNYPELSRNDRFWAWRLSPPETLDIVHPLLRKWVIGSPVATKLTATLSPANMRKDVWIDWTPFAEKQSCRFSLQGAAILALNWGAGIFAAGLFSVCLFVFANKSWKPKLPLLIGIVTAGGIFLGGLIYLFLPKIEVRLVAGPFQSISEAQWILIHNLDNSDWHTITEARAILRKTVSTPNYFVGGQMREEDSPGNYLLRETNNQLQLIFFYPNGEEEISETQALSIQR
jgi:hypothetical protein